MKADKPLVTGAECRQTGSVKGRGSVDEPRALAEIDVHFEMLCERFPSAAAMGFHITADRRVVSEILP